MNFISLNFLYLMCVTNLFLILFSKHNWQNRILLVASYVFYGWWNWKYLWLIIGISLIDYLFALLLNRRDNKNYRRLMLSIGISANLFILCYFKYIDFFIDSFNNISNIFGTKLTFPLQHVLLPIAISFHTFQSMSYLIDVFWKRIQPVKNILDYQLFVSFFPVLVAGPIERAENLLPQILYPRKVLLGDWIEGLN